MSKKKETYNPLSFWLFIACLGAIIGFALGDDDYNLLVDDANWFLFQEPLLISVLFVYIKYYINDIGTFQKADLKIFIPYLIYSVLEVLTLVIGRENNKILATLDYMIELSFLSLLIIGIFYIIKNQKGKWLLVFLIPFTLIFLIDELSKIVSIVHQPILYVDSYGMFLTSIFLFYFVTYRLIVAPEDIIKLANNKYKSSSLSNKEVQATIDQLKQLFENESVYRNQKLSVQEVATQLGITRQQLSEILNVHMGQRFQDLLNSYRIDAFIKCLKDDNYENYTLFGIATEVGFSSKSTFNATFKKLKGMTPSQYKKSNS